MFTYIYLYSYIHIAGGLYRQSREIYHKGYNWTKREEEGGGEGG